MASRKEEKALAREERLRREAERDRAKRARKLQIQIGSVAVAAIAVLGVLFAVNSAGGGDGSSAGSTDAKGGGAAGQFRFDVGDPGPGKKAPPVRLQSTKGDTFDLGDRRGKTVLLYFQEGLMCQPCWDQIVDLEKDGGLRKLGIDEMVSITTDELGQIQMKVEDEGIKAPVLSDPDLRVSKAYAANKYGMMGDSRDGHSFMVVGPDGRIRFRADYGGPPDFTMYVPVKNLLADLRKGLRESAS